MLASLGKFLLVLSLCVQGGLIMFGTNSKAEYETHLLSLSKSVPQLAPLLSAQETKCFDCIRYALGGLYALSSLILVCGCCSVPFFASLGVICNTVVLTLPALMVNPQDKNALPLVLKNVSIVAGLFYLMGVNCQKNSNKLKVD